MFFALQKFLVEHGLLGGTGQIAQSIALITTRQGLERALQLILITAGKVTLRNLCHVEVTLAQLQCGILGQNGRNVQTPVELMELGNEQELVTLDHPTVLEMTQKPKIATEKFALRMEIGLIGHHGQVAH